MRGIDKSSASAAYRAPVSCAGCATSAFSGVPQGAPDRAGRRRPTCNPGNGRNPSYEGMTHTTCRLAGKRERCPARSAGRRTGDAAPAAPALRINAQILLTTQRKRRARRSAVYLDGPACAPGPRVPVSSGLTQWDGGAAHDHVNPAAHELRDSHESEITVDRSAPGVRAPRINPRTALTVTTHQHSQRHGDDAGGSRRAGGLTGTAV
jgi:hypothetical protein